MLDAGPTVVSEDFDADLGPTDRREGDGSVPGVLEDVLAQLADHVRQHFPTPAFPEQMDAEALGGASGKEHVLRSLDEDRGLRFEGGSIMRLASAPTRRRLLARKLRIPWFRAKSVRSCFPYSIPNHARGNSKPRATQIRPLGRFNPAKSPWKMALAAHRDHASSSGWTRRVSELDDDVATQKGSPAFEFQ